MEKALNRIIGIVTATSTAGAVAPSLAYIANYNFGLSRQDIRIPAVAGAAVIAVLVAVEFFGKKLHKPS